MLIEAVKDVRDKELLDVWKTLYPFMVMKQIEHVEFHEFKDKATQKSINYSDISSEEIENEMIKLVAAYEGGEK